MSKKPAAKSSAAAVAAAAAPAAPSGRFETVADIESSPEIVAAIYTHVSMMPPHGAFMHLSACDLSIRLSANLGVNVAPSLLMTFFARNWELDQWRSWAPYYCAVAFKNG